MKTSHRTTSHSQKLHRGNVEEPQVFFFPTKVCYLNPRSEIKGGVHHTSNCRRGESRAGKLTQQHSGLSSNLRSWEKAPDRAPLKDGWSDDTLNSHKPVSPDPHDWCIKGTKRSGQSPGSEMVVNSHRMGFS